MNTFPVMLKLQGRLAVVVGGGEVGRRKALALREAGATVRLVTGPRGDAGDLARQCEVLDEAYRPDLLAGATVVIACTDEPPTNAQIAEDARALGAWVNVADEPGLCDFFLPAVHRRGAITLAVGTGGAAPGLAGYLRTLLADALPEQIEAFAASLSEIRNRTADVVDDAKLRMALLKSISEREGLEAFRRGGSEALSELAEQRLADLTDKETR